MSNINRTDTQSMRVGQFFELMASVPADKQALVLAVTNAFISGMETQRRLPSEARPSA